MRKPFIKFICHSASYVAFLILLILASQRIESLININSSDGSSSGPKNERRGPPPTVIEWMIMTWIAGLVWTEIKQLWDDGLYEYVHDMWNVLDFITNSLYIATIGLRVVAYLQVQKEISENKLRDAYAQRMPNASFGMHMTQH
uniref:Eka-Trpl2 protein n=1 Tax=Euperipatoides kanangrensis TaxID=488523 RepID=A0A0F7VJG6_9BILA|nr:Eka-Trpl2 protein [Euperipatoides kanangrensis]